MELSLFLAKSLGLYFLIVSLSLFINKDRFSAIIAGIVDNAALRLLMGIMTLIVGILLVVSHNVWEANWIGLITLIGWITFIKGILNVAFPRCTECMAQCVSRSRFTLYVSALIYLAFGLILCCYGFWMV